MSSNHTDESKDDEDNTDTPLLQGQGPRAGRTIDTDDGPDKEDLLCFLLDFAEV